MKIEFIYIRLAVMTIFAYFIYIGFELHFMRKAIENISGSLYNMDNRMND